MSKLAFLSTVKGRLLALIALFVLVVLVTSVYSFSVLNGIRVGGPVYQRIVQTMNVRADTHSPSQYLVEAELIAFQLASQMTDQASAGIADAVVNQYDRKLKKLKKEFDEGQLAWEAQLPSDSERARNLRVLLLEKNGKVGSDYFTVEFGEFLPAIRANDKKQVDQLLHGSMKQLWGKHLKIMEDVAALLDESARENDTNVTSIVSRSESFAVVFSVSMLGCATILAIFALRAITRPVQAAVHAVKLLEGGDFNVSVDEFGTDELGQMCRSLNRAIVSVRGMIQSADVSSRNLAQYSQSLATVATGVDVGVHRQAANLEQTGAQLGEMASLSQSIAMGGREGQEAALQSSRAADTGIEVIQSAIAGMQTISKAAAEIAQIVDAVDEICFNTSLLSVNASVEAAVAGEAGRGFRVVAGEIKALSVRTEAAGKKIRQLIRDTSDAIGEGTGRVEASGHAFAEIGNCVRRLKAIMDDVANSSATQADSIQQVREAIHGISLVVDQNSIGTGTINQTAKDLGREARNMRELVSAFKV